MTVAQKMQRKLLHQKREKLEQEQWCESHGGVAKLIKSIKEETKGQTDEIFAHGGYCLMIIFDLNCRIFFNKDFEKEDSCPHIY